MSKQEIYEETVVAMQKAREPQVTMNYEQQYVKETGDKKPDTDFFTIFLKS